MAIDWTKSMTQTFEIYEVDPGTWKDVTQIRDVKSCSITRDAEADTLGSAFFDVTESPGECYLRVYLIAQQGIEKEKVPLGTFLVQTPSTSFNGRITDISLDAYTPLIELKEKSPDIGYSILKDDKINILARAYDLTWRNVRAPVVEPNDDTVLQKDFVADTSDTWLTFISDLIANAEYTFGLDELSRILFEPETEPAAMQPVWTYNDDNSSILYPDISLDNDLYGIPNVVEVVYSYGNGYIYGKAVNDSESSPISTVNRGREILYRETSPNLDGNSTQAQIQEYAELLLKDLSTIEYTVSYTHGYCPVRLGDCVRLNYSRAGITDIKAKVVYQSIDCTSGCAVTEKATFSTQLWEG